MNPTSSDSLSISSDFEEAFYKKQSSQNFYEPVFYYVKPGDTLSQIITSYYDIRYGTKEYDTALAHVLFSNQHIKNANAIKPKQIISLTPMTPRYGPMCIKYNMGPVLNTSPIDSNVQHFLSNIPSDPQEREMFWTLSWLQLNYNFFANGVGVGLNSMGGIARKQNTQFIMDVERAYSEYKSGKIRKGVYDYKRKVALKNYANRVGPFEKLLFNGKSTQQAIRINRTKALPANSDIMKYAGKLNKMSKIASQGGIALTVLGVAKGGYDMCQAETLDEKNDILVETLSGAIGGTLVGVGAGILLASTPVGWISVLAIGLISGLSGYGLGQGAKAIYNLDDDPIDFVSLINAQAVCNLGIHNPERGFDKLKSL